PYAHMTVSPVPAPSRSATTTIFFVGSLLRSYGCTTRKRTPSRSGDFFVDQTVPMTLPRNIKTCTWDLALWSLQKTWNNELSTKFKVHVLANTSAGSPISRADGVMMVRSFT